MKVLVTGGGGFIGANLVRLLVQKRHQVVVLDNFMRGNKLELSVLRDGSVVVIEGDIRDMPTVKKAFMGVDLCYHLAAVLGVEVVAEKPIDTMDIEAVGIGTVADAAVAAGNIPIIYTSTSGVYGKELISQAVHEDFPVSPSSSYAIAKRYGEFYLKSFWQEKKLPSISARLFNVYGPLQDDRMVVPRFISAAMGGVQLNVYGKGNQTRDFTFISDVVQYLYRLKDCVSGCEVVNIATSIETSILDLAHLVIKIMDNGELHPVPSPADREDFEVVRRAGQYDKLQRMLGSKFQGFIDLESGLRSTLEWMKRHT